MPTAALVKELQTVERLISTLKPNEHFVEDLVCLEMNRKALRAAIAVGRPQSRSRRRGPLARWQLAEERTQRLVKSLDAAD